MRINHGKRIGADNLFMSVYMCVCVSETQKECERKEEREKEIGQIYHSLTR